MANEGRGIGINIIRKNGEMEEVGGIRLMSMPYYDIVFAGSPITMFPGDSMTISFDVPIIYIENNVEVSRMTDQWEYTTGELEEKTTVSLVRIIKVGGEAWIDLAGEMPESQIPSSAIKAKKIR